MRQSVNDAMDIHGGKGICDGPSNYLSNGYQGLPISITVEGANILTRSLIIFGQGALRCHPYLLQEMQAAHNPDNVQALVDFDAALWGHVGFGIGNFGRALWHNLTAGRFASAPEVGADTIPYYRQLSRASASFALVADVALLLLGGEFKRKEKLSARFGDILSEMYLLSCALKRFEDDRRPQADLPLLQWNCQNGLHTIEQRFDEILANFPSRWVGWVLRWVVFPWGRRCRRPSDRLGERCAEILLSPSRDRDRLTAGMFLSREPEDVTGRLEYALGKVLAAEAVEARLKAAGHGGTLQQAIQAGIISDMDVQLIAEAERATHRVIGVDDFDPEELTGRPVQLYGDKPVSLRAVQGPV
jgi:acyl-CoA dehydrogenase